MRCWGSALGTLGNTSALARPSWGAHTGALRAARRRHHAQFAVVQAAAEQPQQQNSLDGPAEASTSDPAPALQPRLRRRLGKPAAAPAARPAAAAANAPLTKAAPRSTAPSSRRSQTQLEEDAEYFKDKDRFERTILDERSPFYQPVLTDEDLAEDPPGHKSGYVAVIGKPNAGKSTLINALVGQKLSIVTYKPQTTRHRIMGITSDKHYQMILFDTPGVIEKKRTKLEERMMAAVITSIKEAEAIISVVDCADNPRDALGMFQPGDNWTGPPMAVLLNKADLLSPEQVEELSAWYRDNCKAEAVFVGSAHDKHDTGVAQAKAWAVEKLPEGPTLYPKNIISEQPERFFVSECIREQIFLLTQQEVPYCTQVVVREFRERTNGLKDFILAEVVVEKESQKGIIIGSGGSMLKKIGLEARKEIEAFLERGVYLELSVQVSKDWRDSKDALNKYGYFDPMLI